MAIRIEIDKSHKKGFYKLRIGDLSDSIDCSMITEEEVLNIIREEMEKIE